MVEDHVDGNNKSVQTQDLGENKNKDHADVQSWLLSCASNTGVTDNTDSITGRQTRQTYSQTSSKVDKSAEKLKTILRGLSTNESK